MQTPREIRIQWYKDFLKEFQDDIWPVFNGTGITMNTAFLGFIYVEGFTQSPDLEEEGEEEEDVEKWQKPS